MYNKKLCLHVIPGYKTNIYTLKKDTHTTSKVNTRACTHSTSTQPHRDVLIGEI